MTHPTPSLRTNAVVQAAQRGLVVSDFFGALSLKTGFKCSGFCTPALQAAQRVPVVGDIVGALWELRDLVAVASGNAANCATLAAFGADIMRTFDFQGGHFGCGYKQTLHLDLGCKKP
jgi:hypothetical protein